MTDSRLLQRLHAFRRRVRTRLVLFGVCAVASGALFGSMLLVGMDWLLELPSVPRLVAGLAFVICVVTGAIRWVVRPLLRPISLGQIAGTLEDYDWQLGGGDVGKFDDRLSSTVDFLLGNQAGSQDMRRQVVANTDRLVANIRFGDALSLRPLLARVVGLAAASVLLLLIAAGSPDFARVGLRRFVAPFSAVRWPRTVQILPLSASLNVPVGESTTLRMQVVRGLKPTLRGVVHLRDSDDRITKLAMQREDDGQYVCTLSAVSENLTAWFEAGDDDTRDRPIRIRLVKRPVVIQALATIDPPPYAPEASSLVVDLRSGAVAAVVGSAITVSLRVSKPVGTESSGQPTAALEFASGDVTPLAYSGDDQPESLEGAFELQTDAEFRVRLTDTNGFENPSGRSFRLAAKPDETPEVVLLEPQALTEVTPAGAVALLIRAEDDLGLTDLAIIARTIDAEGSIRVPLTEHMSVMADGERVLALSEYVWELASLGLEPGDGLVFHVEATDNYAYRGAGPQTGRSPPRRIKIISAEEFQERLRTRFALLQDRIRQAMLDQQALRDQTDAAGSKVDTDLESIVGLASRQGRLAGRIQSLARRFQRILRRLELNRVQDATLGHQVGQLAQRLLNAALGPASAASRSLSEAGDAATTQHPGRLRGAADDQQEVVDELARLIRFMDQWGEFQEAVAKTRSLLDRQQAERQRTAELGRRTLGQRPESLPDQQQAELRQAQRRQLQIAEETAQLVEQLRGLAKRLEAKDPAGAAALEEALRAGVAADVEEHMREAGQAIEANRMAAAAIEQRAAQTGLANMLAGLQERRKRELAALAKKIEDARQTVVELLRQQRELLEANVEANRLGVDPDVFARQAGQQRSLRRNTAELAAEMESRDQIARPARLVQRSTGPMEQAETALSAADSPTAQAQQSEAADLLAEALAELEDLAQKAADEAWKRSLAALRDKLQDIRDRQQSLNVESSEIINLVEQRQRLGRREFRRVARLAKAQQLLGPEVAGVRQQLGKAAVYAWVIDRVLELIGQAGDALVARRLDEALANAQAQIVAELDVLITALDEAVRLPSLDEYADGQSGGGGAGGADARGKSPVPGVAELLVLKALQLDLNRKTARYAPDFDVNTATEQQLAELQQLGVRQQKVRELTETVTRRAEQGHP